MHAVTEGGHVCATSLGREPPATRASWCRGEVTGDVQLLPTPADDLAPRASGAPAVFEAAVDYANPASSALNVISKTNLLISPPLSIQVRRWPGRQSQSSATTIPVAVASITNASAPSVGAQKLQIRQLTPRLPNSPERPRSVPRIILSTASIAISSLSPCRASSCKNICSQPDAPIPSDESG